MLKKPFNPLDENEPSFGEYCLVWDVVFGRRETFTEETVSDIAFSIDAHSGEWVGMSYTL